LEYVLLITHITLSGMTLDHSIALFLPSVRILVVLRIGLEMKGNSNAPVMEADSGNQALTLKDLLQDLWSDSRLLWQMMVKYL